ncbi:MAG: hypothetical protein KAI66_24785 [Lentisphaeria bacterium]|nr:hypothetical protein [Lentisphaeria bacterium]
MASDFDTANQVLRDGAIEYGNVNFDPPTNLVRRVDKGKLDEMIVDGQVYARKPLTLKAGSTVGWRAGETLVVIRLLQARGMPADSVGRPTPWDHRRKVAVVGKSDQMELVWDSAANRVLSQTVNGRPVETSLRYDSPLIRLADGDTPAAMGPSDGRRQSCRQVVPTL